MRPQNKNLIPFNKRSPEELKALSRKGGIASGEARRKKREQIEAIKLRDKAIKEERDGNIAILRRALKLLNEVKKYY